MVRQVVGLVWEGHEVVEFIMGIISILVMRNKSLVFAEHPGNIRPENCPGDPLALSPWLVLSIADVLKVTFGGAEAGLPAPAGGEVECFPAVQAFNLHVPSNGLAGVVSSQVQEFLNPSPAKADLLGDHVAGIVLFLEECYDLFLYQICHSGHGVNLLLLFSKHSLNQSKHLVKRNIHRKEGRNSYYQPFQGDIGIFPLPWSLSLNLGPARADYVPFLEVFTMTKYAINSPV